MFFPYITVHQLEGKTTEKKCKSRKKCGRYIQNLEKEGWVYPLEFTEWNNKWWGRQKENRWCQVAGWGMRLSFAGSSNNGTPLQDSCLKIPWTEEPGGLQSMGSWRVGHDWGTSLSLFTFMHWRRKWQPTPVFLLGESQGRRSLVGCCLWGRTESDTTEVT